MTEKGAVTQAIEALDKSLRQSCAVNPDGSPYLIEALEALKAFKDGVPEGLKNIVENMSIYDSYVIVEGSAEIMVMDFYKAGKHLQDAIK